MTTADGSQQCELNVTMFCAITALHFITFSEISKLHVSSVLVPDCQLIIDVFRVSDFFSFSLAGLGSIQIGIGIELELNQNWWNWNWN